ncbi:hypothetical protein MA16_Dca011179 [Dendrobium catenatum]|uniref:Uncharacterized protein n=1 Tax=Dendrobium catenatum TaxID=906689 RepID=A0A2I0VIG5_9ASPA|nr:hypothetical protein MA16_Dca011179 [Dendrobium catenatum]
MERVTHYFDESFLQTEEDSVNIDSKSHLSESIVEESSKELVVIYLINASYHEKWIQIFDNNSVSAKGLKEYQKG